jgi:hypothetical protein
MMIVAKQTLLSLSVPLFDTSAGVSFRNYLKAAKFNFCPHGATARSDPGPPHYLCFTNALSHTTIGKNPLDERSARHRDL